MKKLQKMVVDKLFDIHSRLSNIDSVSTLKEDLEEVSVMVRDLGDAVQLADYPVTDNRGFNEVSMSKDEPTYLFKDSAEIVTKVISKYSPREVKIETPKEALEWYDYLTNCTYTPNLELAKTILFNYIVDNLKK